VKFEDFMSLLTTTSISLKAAFGAAILGLMSLAYMLGYSHADQPKEKVCALEIKLVDEYKNQLKFIEKEYADKLQAAQMSCMQREQDVCSGRMEKFSESLQSIQCKICERRKLRK
jgi:hypothetical protein